MNHQSEGRIGSFQYSRKIYILVLTIILYREGRKKSLSLIKLKMVKQMKKQLSNEARMEMRKAKKRENEKRWLVEARAELLFLLSGGMPKSNLSGVLLKKGNGKTMEPETASVHHMVALNGKRGSGKKQRLLEMRRNMWNLLLVSASEHVELHNSEDSKVLETNQLMKDALKEVLV